MSDQDPAGEATVLSASSDDLDVLRPRVRRAAAGPSALAIGFAACVLGVLAFMGISAHRLHAHGVSQTAETAGPPGSSAQPIDAPPPPPAVDALAREARGAAPAPSAAVPAPPPPPITPTLAPVAVPPAPEQPGALRSAVLVVDLTRPDPTLAAAPPAAGTPKPGDASRPAALAAESADEKFRDRVGAEGEPEHARASMLRNQKTLIPQGTLIPAVLETALNSDLPGFARAVVSRDVSSFDGGRVLVPRGSRVIGEYKSALALGQSRAFVIWTRIIRPDGASIQIGSGGGDPLGRAGLAGSVDNHFFERFGGAVLLTVLNAGVNAAAGAPSTEVVIGSSQQAAGLAGSASSLTPANIPPTIKVPQGTPLRIFVAKDLDFSAVEVRAP